MDSKLNTIKLTGSDYVEKINVLDKGYVILHDFMGEDLRVVNSARVSHDKESEELSERDVRLINYLGDADPEHSEPFYHPILHFEVYAPLMVARQWWKYITGSEHRDTFTAWSESSRRYITENEEFYVPEADEWRSYPDNVKQGSGEPVHNDLGRDLTEALETYIELGEKAYNTALESGVAPEQARLFLPAYGMYVRWRWTGSLKSVAHFLNQRLDKDAQFEIREYAEAVKSLVESIFPNSLNALLK